MSPRFSEAFFKQTRHRERGRGCETTRFEIALDVFAEDIAFEVDRVAGFVVLDVGVLVGVGNYGDFRDARAAVPSRGLRNPTFAAAATSPSGNTTKLLITAPLRSSGARRHKLAPEKNPGNEAPVAKPSMTADAP